MTALLRLKSTVHITTLALSAVFGVQKTFALNDGVAKLPGTYTYALSNITDIHYL